MSHLIVFRATGRCHRCHAALTGLITHHGAIHRNAVRILDDDPVIVWGPCPSGCMDFQCYPASDVALTGLSEASQVLVETERAKVPA